MIYTESNINKLSIKLLVFCITTFFFTNAYGEKLNPDLGNFSQSSGKGYKISGICLSSVGGACIVASIPLFVSAIHKAEEHGMIDSNIRSTFGSCFFIGGIVFGGISIPFYIKHKKLNKGLNISFNFSSNNINMIYDF